MMATLETGFFIWNFAAWLKVFVFSSFFFCLAVFIIKKRTGGSLAATGSIRGLTGEERGRFEEKIRSFRLRVMNPWFDMPYSHLLTMSVLFLLFLAALFSKSGVK